MLRLRARRRAMACAYDAAESEVARRVCFPVIRTAEKAHGTGIYDRLRLLPDLPLGKVCEMGRFVKNQLVSGMSELLTRAPVEVLLAVSDLLRGPLRDEVDA